MNNKTNLSESEQIDESLQGILFETSPYGNLDAVVQHDQRTVYFYINGDESFGTRACWVRNLIDGPLVFNEDDLQSGQPPLMPKTHTTTPDQQHVPTPESLEIVWFEEGNGAALFEHEELLAVIPPWSGNDGFHGYSSQCAHESPIAWPMVEHQQLATRITRAREFWLSCASEKRHPFQQLQESLLSAYYDQFQVEGRYYSLDGGQFPPRGAVVYRTDTTIFAVSAGMSLRPQPNVEMFVEHPSDVRRIEIAIELENRWTDEELAPVLQQLSGLVAYPWNAFTWFGAGHTCQSPQLAPFTNTDSVRFESSSHQSQRTLSLPDFRGDPIQLLWLNPVR